jgi:hypothetical protein
LAALHHLLQQLEQYLRQPVAAVIHLPQIPLLLPWSNAGAEVEVVVSIKGQTSEAVVVEAGTTMHLLFLKQELHIR